MCEIKGWTGLREPVKAKLRSGNLVLRGRTKSITNSNCYDDYGVNINLTSIVWLLLAPTPVRARTYAPGGVFALVTTVKVVLPIPVKVSGLKLADVLCGSPDPLKVIGLANSPDVVTLIEYVALFPGATDREGGATESMKSPFVVTVVGVESKLC